MASGKRKDLQSIRGTAIIAVLLFHFFPKQFPNGFIGVDIFFVLSGYLIALVLQRESKLNPSTVLEFYYKRVKRIVPLYSLIVLLTVMSMYTVFPISDLYINIQSAWLALFFLTNIANSGQDMDYSDMLAESRNLFTHSWSLSVEIQFYLLIPIIFYILRKFPQDYSTIIIAVTGTLSFYYQLNSPPLVAFYSVFARMWQFCIGVQTYRSVAIRSEDDGALLPQENSSENTAERVIQERPASVWMSVSASFLLGTILGLSLFWDKIVEQLLRFLVTTLTALLILSNHNDSHFLLSNPILVCIGDVSYALYLIHWPICVYGNMKHEGCTATSLLGLSFSVLLSLAIFECFEKVYLRFSKQSILLLVSSFYIVTALLLPHSNSIEKSLNKLVLRDNDLSSVTSFRSRATYTLEEAIAKNLQDNLADISNLKLESCDYEKPPGPFDWCHFKDVGGRGSSSLSILLVGNSYAPNTGRDIYEFCHTKVKSMTMLSFAVCEVLVVTNYEKTDCKAVQARVLQGVKEEKPDILFILQRHLTFMKKSDEFGDKLYDEARKTLREIESSVGKSIYILDAIPTPSSRVVSTINQYLARGNTTIPHWELDGHAHYWNANKRVRKLIEDCRKCKRIDYLPYFAPNGTFVAYDVTNGLSYFTEPLHLSPHGWNLVRPVYRNICEHL